MWLMKLFLSLVSLMALTLSLTLVPKTPAPHLTNLPRFQSKTCFNLNGIREPWQSNGPDGIVVMRGYENYLVLYREEADRRYAGPKSGVSVPITEFDVTHYEVECPASWLTKGRHT